MRPYLRFLPLGLFVLPLFLLLQPVRGAVTEWLAPVVIDAGHDPTVGVPAMSIINGEPAMAYVVRGNGKYTLAYQRALDADGADWTPFDQRVAVHSSNGWGWNRSLSLAEVNGRPAIAFIDGDVLNYVRAGDGEGLSWQAPISLLPNLAGDPQPQLFVVNGAPVILYLTSIWDDVNFITIYDLWYLRAQDANGAVWNAPVKVDLGGTFSPPHALALVNGLPAVAYQDADGGGLNYSRALNSGGEAWTEPITLYTGSDYARIALTSRESSGDGEPAVSFLAGEDVWAAEELYYVEAADANGTVWQDAELVVEAGEEEWMRTLFMADMDAAPVICYVFNTYIYYSVQLRCLASDNYEEPVTVPGSPDIFALLQVNGQPALGTNTYYGIHYNRAADSTGATWYWPIQLAAKRSVGYPSALSEVEGMPAVGYYHEQAGDLLYAQGQNAQGATWATPVVVDSGAGGDVGRFHSLAVVNGNPAMSYYDFSNWDLKYVRALDPSGATWGEPVVVDSNGDAGRGNFLTVIDGRPAIGYVSSSESVLKIVRAADANGAIWNNPKVIEEAGNANSFYSFALIGGRMAVAFKSEYISELMYSWAKDVAGQNWSAPVVVSDSTYGEFMSLQEINGRPAVVFAQYNEMDNSQELWYSRSEDAGGSEWGDPVLIEDEISSSSWELQMFLIQKDNKPAVVFRNNGLYYVEAEDAAGASWGESEPALSGNDYFNNPMRSFAAVINGCPSASFHPYPDVVFTQMNCAGEPATPTPTATAPATATPTATPTATATATPTVTPQPSEHDAFIPMVIR